MSQQSRASFRLRPLASIGLLGAFALFSCDPLPLAPRSIVVSPRIIGIIAEPPEVAPGQLVQLRPITGGIEPNIITTYRWLVCARPEATSTFTAQSTFGQAQPDEGCFGDAAVGVFPIGEGERIAFGVPADLLTRLDALRAVYGANLSEASLRRIAQTAGIPFTIALEMTSGSTVVRAIKRVVVVDRTDRNANPPPPQFQFGLVPDAGTGGVHVGPVAGSEDECRADNGMPLTVQRNQRVEIAPDPTEAPWLQQYDALDSAGGITRSTENAFYSWSSSAGSFSDDRTRIPTRNTLWTAPGRAATVTMWLVVRDGRGGTSFCKFAVVVP